MYIKMYTDKIRVRISRAEAEQLLKQGLLEHTTQLDELTNFNFQIKTVDVESNCHYLDQNRLFSLLINKQALAIEMEHRPSKKGIEILRFNPNQIVALEIDLKRSSQR
ncbi:MAG: hypothetical protein KUG78_00715 [Kangiellaceae bacterium]|nr:hypothetical protein [Kangiellaceae bacterium]